MCTVSGKARVQMKILFFPDVGNHFLGDRSHTLDDCFSEVILILNVFKLHYPLVPKIKWVKESDVGSYLDPGFHCRSHGVGPSLPICVLQT